MHPALGIVAVITVTAGYWAANERAEQRSAPSAFDRHLTDQTVSVPARLISKEIFLDRHLASAPPLARELRAPETVPGVYTEAMLCLAETIYWEARGEPERGQKAVADVVMMRVERRWRGAETVCEVARDTTRKGERVIYQFEGMVREGDRKADRDAWAMARRIAKRRLTDPWPPVVAADHFWAGCDRVPGWVRRDRMREVECIGRHWFWHHA